MRRRGLFGVRGQICLPPAFLCLRLALNPEPQAQAFLAMDFGKMGTPVSDKAVETSVSPLEKCECCVISLPRFL